MRLYGVIWGYTGPRVLMGFCRDYLNLAMLAMLDAIFCK